MSSVFPWLGSGSKMFRVQIMLRAVYIGQWDTFSANGKLWEDTHLLPTHTYPSILRADLEKSGCLLLIQFLNTPNFLRTCSIIIVVL